LSQLNSDFWPAGQFVSSLLNWLNPICPRFSNCFFSRSNQVEFVANPRIDHVCLSLNTSKTPQLRPNRIEPELSQSEKLKKKVLCEIICMSSGLLRVARGSFGAEAPPLAARYVPWNGQGRRLVELTVL